METESPDRTRIDHVSGTNCQGIVTWLPREHGDTHSPGFP